MWIICFSHSLLELGGEVFVEEAVKQSFLAINGGANTKRKKKMQGNYRIFLFVV